LGEQRLEVVGSQVIDQPVLAEDREHTLACLVLIVESPQSQLPRSNPRLLGKKECVHKILDREPLSLAAGLPPSVQVIAIFNVSLKCGVNDTAEKHAAYDSIELNRRTRAAMGI
jgi:hypothetical protein